jgi:hypothetical protein
MTERALMLTWIEIPNSIAAFPASLNILISISAIGPKASEAEACHTITYPSDDLLESVEQLTAYNPTNKAIFDFILGSVDVYKHIGLPFFSFSSATTTKCLAYI